MEGDWGERVVQKMVGGIQKHRLLQQGLSAFFPLSRFCPFLLPLPFLRG